MREPAQIWSPRAYRAQMPKPTGPTMSMAARPMSRGMDPLTASLSAVRTSWLCKSRAPLRNGAAYPEASCLPPVGQSTVGMLASAGGMMGPMDMGAAPATVSYVRSPLSWTGFPSLPFAPYLEGLLCRQPTRC
jgi:hypothetical protein